MSTEIELVHWNPRRFAVPVVRRVPWLRDSEKLTTARFGPRVRNFGDLLGPDIVRRILQNAFGSESPQASRRARLLSVGSVMHFAQDGDVVWGSGVNGKVDDSQHSFHALDVRAVRGPLTMQWLRDKKGINAPAVFGDPGLLVPRLFPEIAASSGGRTGGAVVPNLHDFPGMRHLPGVVDPRQPWQKVARTIASSDYVISTSLHGYILAEAFGVPAVLMRSGAEPSFKYDDYLLGTGRTELALAADYPSAVEMVPGARRRSVDVLASWDPTPLLESFPVDLWRSI